MIFNHFQDALLRYSRGFLLMWKAKLALGLLAATVVLSGCKVQTVQQYENEQKEQSDKVVVVDEQQQKATDAKDEKTEKKTAITEETNKKQEKPEQVKEQATQKLEPIVTEQIASADEPEPLTKTENKKIEKKAETPKQAVKPTVEKSEKPKKVETSKTEKKEVATTTKPEKSPATATSSDTEVYKKPTSSKAEDKKEYATVSIGMKVLINKEYYDLLPEALQSTKYVPANGSVISGVKVEIKEGAKAWDAIFQVTKKYHIPIDYKKDPLMGVYIEGINHVYEKQAGTNSGWMYTVNGVKAPVGVGSYTLKDNDAIELQYTTNSGTDLGW